MMTRRAWSLGDDRQVSATAMITIRAVPAVPLGAGHRNLAPGQRRELGVQAGLVALDDQQVVRAAPGQVGGVLTLGVQSIGGDDRIPDIRAVQQRAEQGTSLVLAPTSTWPGTAP